MKSNVYYRHSGKFSLVGLMLIFTAPVIAAAIFSFVYSALVHYNPFIYINLLGTLIFGAATGVAVAKVGVLGKVRSSGLTFFASLVAGSVAIYLSWVSYVFILSGYEALILSPGELWNVVRGVAVVGVWSVFGATPSGALLFGIWAIEALIIVALVMIVAQGELTDGAFCEKSKSWADQRSSVGPFAEITNPETFRRKIEEGDYSELLSLQPGERTKKHAMVEFIGASKNPDFQLFSVLDVTIKSDKEGKKTEEKEDVVKHVISTPDINRSIMLLLNRGSESDSTTETIASALQSSKGSTGEVIA